MNGRSNGATGAVHAAIDVGTNSFHLVVARTSSTGGFEVLAAEKEMVRLGAGAGSGDIKSLTPDAIDRGIDALRRFRQVADIWDADITAVATSAVREAENGEVLVQRALEEAGVVVEVISGIEEARLIRLGAIQAVKVFDRQHLVIDIGGGSTEFVVGKGAEVLEARSVKLGAVRLLDRFFPDGKVDDGAVDACRRHVRSYLNPAVRDVGRYGARRRGRVLGHHRHARGHGGHPPHRAPPRHHQRALAHPSGAEAGRRRGGRCEDDEGPRPTGGPRRAPGRHHRARGGAARADLPTSSASTSSPTRTSRCGRGCCSTAPVGSTRRPASARPGSAIRVAPASSTWPPASTPTSITPATSSELALALFDQIAPVHGLGAEDRELLAAAGMLHNVGLAISHASHHRHSYYVIRNSDLLTGFNNHEIELIAQVARYHRKSMPRPKHDEFGRLSLRDRLVVRVLAGVLRVAIGLDRTHAGLVRALRATVDDERRRLLVELDVAPGADPSLELYTAEERCALLAETLDLDVAFSVA